MTQTNTELSAVIACYFMKRWNYEPKSIINVGVGSSYEINMWRWLLPEAQLMGIDTRLRHRKWDAPYIKAGASSKSGETLSYCRWCRSVKCNLPDHINRYEVKSITIDEVAGEMPGPYFLWLDCEGSELDALRGASETLKHTRFVSLEVREYMWTTNYRQELHGYLASLGFGLRFESEKLDDRLYHRRGGTV